jgi:hypothetical protein
VEHSIRRCGAAVLVIALLALLACRPPRSIGSEKRALAKFAVDNIAFMVGPRWAMENPTSDCPPSLLGIADLLGLDREATVDPWGKPYELLCGKGRLPPGVSSGFAAVSLGPDGQRGTADDVESWTPLRPR